MKKQPFDSGSRGLNKLVQEVQNVPNERYARDIEDSLHLVLDKMERISNLSDASPGAAHKDRAIEICWDVYKYLQNRRDMKPGGRVWAQPETISTEELDRDLV